MVMGDDISSVIPNMNPSTDILAHRNLKYKWMFIFIQFYGLIRRLCSSNCNKMTTKHEYTYIIGVIYFDFSQTKSSQDKLHAVSSCEDCFR